MVSIKRVNKEQKDWDKIKELYFEAFPKEEIIPLWILMCKAKKNRADFWAVYDENQLVGITYICHGDNNIVFILYLATISTVRGAGYGTKILNQIKKKYPNKRIILNIEMPDESALNSVQRLKRKRFYEKNGFSDLNYSTVDGGVEYKMMGFGEPVTKSEYNELMKAFMGKFIYFIVNLIYRD